MELTGQELIDSPLLNDNRRYEYHELIHTERAEYPIIAKMIEPGSKVMDLGCGNGSLLENLIREKNVKGKGIEISASGVGVCQKKGLDVTEGKIDEALPYANDSFDYAICNVTLQMVLYPEVLLKEMKRIARYQILSFPNFAHYNNRIDLFMRGRMPRPMLFGYAWYSTGHIHQFSVNDFLDWMNKNGLEVISAEDVEKKYPLLKKLFPGLFLYIPVYLLKKND